MKVGVVQVCVDYEGGDVGGIYTSKEKAEKRCNQLNEEKKKKHHIGLFDSLHIQDYDLDKEYE